MEIMSGLDHTHHFLGIFPGQGLIRSFDEYLLRSYYVSGIVLSAS